MPTVDEIRRAPKVLLHDHLDGGLRPQTVIELADETGYPDLPTTDPAELSTWMRRGADRKVQVAAALVNKSAHQLVNLELFSLAHLVPRLAFDRLATTGRRRRPPRTRSL